MSRVIRNFQVEELGENFYDPLNNSSIHSSWTQEAGGSTIVEDGTDLTIADAGLSALEWIDGGSQNAPNVNRILEPYNFTAKVYVSGVVSTSTNAGAIVHYLDGTKASYHYIGLSNDGSGDDILTHGKGEATNLVDPSTSGSCWIAMVRRGGGRVMFFYSTNAVGSEPDLDDMTYVRQFSTAFAYNDGRIALVAETRPTETPGINIEFRNFRITYP